MVAIKTLVVTLRVVRLAQSAVDLSELVWLAYSTDAAGSKSRLRCDKGVVKVFSGGLH